MSPSHLWRCRVVGLAPSLLLSGLVPGTLLGCGGVEQDSPSIQSFTIDKQVLGKGGMAMLVAEFEGGTGTVDNGVGAIESGEPIAVSPGANTTYTLTVENEVGVDVSQMTSVDVYDYVVNVPVTAASGLGSLSAAVTGANGQTGTTAITFTVPTPASIDLSATLVVTGDITFYGLGADQLTISGGNERRLFFVKGGKLDLRKLTLSNGRGAGGRGGNAPSGGGGGGAAGMGGAIFINSGAVTASDVTFIGNVVEGGEGGASAGAGTANGGGGGGFGGNGLDGSPDMMAQGGRGAGGGDLGGTGGLPGVAALGDGAGGGGASNGTQQVGGAGGFGAGGGGRGGVAGGAGGFGGGSGGSVSAVSPGMFGGRGASGGGGGAGLGGAIFLRAGTLVVKESRFRNNRALSAPGGAGGASTAGQAKGGAIFALVPGGATLTDVTFEGSVAADNAGSATDSADVYLTQ